MKNRKIFIQIFPTYLGLITLIILFFAIFEQNTLKNFYISELKEDLQARAKLISNQLKDYNIEDDSRVDSLCNVLSSYSGVRITVIRPDGLIIGDSDKDKELMDNHSDRPEIVDAFNNNFGHSIRYSYTLGKQLIYFAIPHKADNKIVAAVRVAYPLSAYEQSLANLRNRIFIASFLLLLLGTLLSYIISRRISKPIEEIKQGAERFASGQFQPALPESGSTEIRSLAATLNSMAKEIHSRMQTISMQRSEQEAMFSSMKEGVLAINKQEEIIRVNPAAQIFFSITDEQAEKRKVFEVIRQPEVLTFIQNAVKSTEHTVQEITVLNKTSHILKLTSDPLRDLNGAIIGSLILINDVTRLKRLDQMRQEFVANVSHELKTPITSIKGYVETLLEEQIDDPEMQNRFLSIIARHADRMNAIITDLLQLSQIEQLEGQQSGLPTSKESLLPILENAVQDCQKLADEKDISLSVVGDTSVQAILNAHLIEHAVINLLVNALKYSEKGSTVNIHLEKNQQELQIAVQDFGVGIEAKHLDRLFERFYRIDKARSRDLGGTGLGLAIVKHITMAHQGNITVESQPGKGSTFTIHLPVL